MSDKLIEKMPLRGRAALALLILLMLFWLPFVWGARALWSHHFKTVPDEYREWWLSIRICAYVLFRGEKWRTTTAGCGE